MNANALKLRLFFALGDVFHLCFSFLLSYKLVFYTIDISEKYLFLLIILCLSWLLLGSFFRLFDYDRAARTELMLSNLLKAFIVNGLMITTLLFTLKANTFSRDYLYLTLFFAFVFLIIWRAFSVLLIKNYRKLGYNYKNVVIIGSGNISSRLHQFFSKKEHGYNLLAIFNGKINHKNFNCPCYSVDELERFCENNSVEEIYYSESIDDEAILTKMILFCDDKMIRLRIVPNFNSFKQRKIKIDFLGGSPVITLREEPLQYELNRIIKRVFDILFSLLVIIFIMTWLVPIIGLFIKRSSKGPIFFKQTRSGLDNKEFTCLKFRSMTLNKMSDLKQATKNDPRTTKIGSFLRRTSLDEMPQFFNVLMGDMSVVGPRPHMLKHTKDYADIIDGYMVRQLVLPGITGSAQVNGFRGETKSIEDMENRVKYDVWYLENWTLLLDIKLIFLTIINLIKGSENAV
ncbi:MAG: undecaprenyl-phosphate glucose phosphotransferase [Flavobacteriales bacterium]|tara:strand:- start:5065 stop:6441 length:1377 start_codon:yes stop_codon:yes gene_type:complete